LTQHPLVCQKELLIAYECIIVVDSTEDRSSVIRPATDIWIFCNLALTYNSVTHCDILSGIVG